MATVGKEKGNDKERRSNYVNIEEMLKRKKDDRKEEKREREEEGFRKSRKTWRIPGEERINLEEMMSEWKENMDAMARGWKGEIKRMKEEVKEGIKKQGRMMTGKR